MPEPYRSTNCIGKSVGLVRIGAESLTCDNHVLKVEDFQNCIIHARLGNAIGVKYNDLFDDVVIGVEVHPPVFVGAILGVEYFLSRIGAIGVLSVITDRRRPNETVGRNVNRRLRSRTCFGTSCTTGTGEVITGAT